MVGNENGFVSGFVPMPFNLKLRPGSPHHSHFKDATPDNYVQSVEFLRIHRSRS
jgi:hypothetical protein